MFCSDEAVNYILNYSKTLIDRINVNRNCPKELKEIQYLIFAGMISYYGFEEIENIHKAFLKPKFIYTNQPFEEHLKSFNIHDDRLEQLSKVGQVGAFVQCGVSQDLLGRFYIDRNIYVIDDKKEAPDFFLEKVIHEVNHVVNSINNAICILNKKKALRTGLYVSCLEDNECMGNLMEEAFNVLQTAEIMEMILEFSQYDIVDPDIKRALDKIKYAYGKKRNGIGYDYTVDAFRGLYNNLHFKKLVQKQRMEGIIKPVRLDFDSKVGDGSYRQFCDTLDKIEVCGPIFWERQMHEEKVKTFIKKYNSSSN